MTVSSQMDPESIWVLASTQCFSDSPSQLHFIKHPFQLAGPFLGFLLITAKTFPIADAKHVNNLFLLSVVTGTSHRPE